MKGAVRTKLIAVLLVVVLIGGGILLAKVLRAGKAAEEAAVEEAAVTVGTVSARRGTMERKLSFSGSLEADVEVGVVSKLPGKVARVLVEEGDTVQRGRLLITLERNDLAAQRHQAQGAIQAAQARLKQAQTGTGLQEAESSTSVVRAEAVLASAKAQRDQARVSLELIAAETGHGVAQAEESVRQAEARLEMLKTGAREQEKEQARQAVQQAKANLDTAKKNLDRARQLLDAGAVAQQQYDAAQLQYDVALAGYNTATQQLDLIEEGARSQEIRIAEAQLAQAQTGLALAKAHEAREQIGRQQLQAAEEQVRQAEAALEMAQAAVARNVVSQEEVEAARAGLAQAQANLQYIDAQIGYTQIRAPVAGVVVRRSTEPGQAAVPGVPLLTIVDNRDLYVRAQVAEMDVGLLYQGQEAVVTIDALRNAEFSGTIAQVIPAADPESRTFEVKVRVPNSDDELTRGMFARVTVVIERAEDAVLVPRHAVIDRDGEQVMYLVQAGRVVERSVVTGIQDENEVVITEGVEVGDAVIVEGQTLVRAGQQVQAKPAEEGSR